VRVAWRGRRPHADVKDEHDARGECGIDDASREQAAIAAEQSQKHEHEGCEDHDGERVGAPRRPRLDRRHDTREQDERENRIARERDDARNTHADDRAHGARQCSRDDRSDVRAQNKGDAHGQPESMGIVQDHGDGGSGSDGDRENERET
jgi:hypothetical protein